MKCLFCEGKAIKNGLYNDHIQRYKCLDCNKTFSERTIDTVNSENNIRLVLHLILSGCSTVDIARELILEEKVIKKWKKLYIKGIRNFVPNKPLLKIQTLIFIYREIEDSRIPKLKSIYRNPRR